MSDGQVSGTLLASEAQKEGTLELVPRMDFFLPSSNAVKFPKMLID